MQGADTNFKIDGYKFLPKSMILEFKEFPYQADKVVKSVPAVPLNKARVSLLTSGGLYLKDRQPSFDLERERREPSWGDPTYRVIPRNVGHGQIAASRLHLNADDIVADFNVALPLELFAEFERDAKIGSLAHDNYSFMGYQGHSTTAWRDVYGPELVQRLTADRINLLILAPT
jgi:D-proline reductase (dithiol) PrdB